MAHQQSLLDQARDTFRTFETTTTAAFEITIDSMEEKIRNFLLMTGAEPSVLDPSGTSTNEEIEQRLQQAAARIRLRMARNIFSTLETTKIDYYEKSIASFYKQINELLTKAGEELSALDPSGTSTNEDIEQRLALAADRILQRRDPMVASFNHAMARKGLVPAPKAEVAVPLQAPPSQAAATTRTRRSPLFTKIQKIFSRGLAQ